MREHWFYDLAEGQCAIFYAADRPAGGLPPRIYFRLLLIGHSYGIVEGGLALGQVAAFCPTGIAWDGRLPGLFRGGGRAWIRRHPGRAHDLDDWRQAEREVKKALRSTTA